MQQRSRISEYYDSESESESDWHWVTVTLLMTDTDGDDDLTGSECGAARAGKKDNTCARLIS